jgi:hypothetical protein
MTLNYDRDDEPWFLGSVFRPLPPWQVTTPRPPGLVPPTVLRRPLFPRGSTSPNTYTEQVSDSLLNLFRVEF